MSIDPDLVLSWLEKVDMPDAWFRKFACWCVRHTPLGDGRTVWDLLTDERSRHAVEVAERFTDDQATEVEMEELKIAEVSAAQLANDFSLRGLDSVGVQGYAAWAAAWAADANAAYAAIHASHWAFDASGEASAAARQAQADHLLADEEFILAVGRAAITNTINEMLD